MLSEINSFTYNVTLILIIGVLLKLRGSCVRSRAVCCFSMSDPVDKIMLRYTTTGMHQNNIINIYHKLIKDCHFYFLTLSETLKQRSNSILAALDHGNR